MNLLVIESPGKANALKAYLGNGWDVVASFGHIRDLPKGRMGVSGPDYKPEYVITARSGVIPKLKAAVQRATQVYIASDPDREGEAIAWHLCEVLNLKGPSVKRVIFNEITQDEVLKAIKNPVSFDTDMVNSQECRRVLDRIVGFTVSPHIRQLVNMPLSAGRVQSIAVRLIAERDLAIQNFVSTNHFGVTISLNDHTAAWNTKPYLVNDQRYIMDVGLAEKVQAVKEVKVLSCEDSQSAKAAPPPFITSTLCRESSTKLKISAPKTMKAAQVLYELGAITYHRTDNLNLSEKGVSLAIECLQARGMGELVRDVVRVHKNKDDAQQAHEAIRPTDFALDAGSIGDANARRVYELIVKRTLASVMQDVEYSHRTIQFAAVNLAVDNKTPEFVAKSRAVTKSGWMEVYQDVESDLDDSKDDAELDQQGLPKYAVGDRLTVQKAVVDYKQTKPPGHHTESSLLKTLEDEGVGRPSTYASIISRVLNAGYVDTVKGGMRITDTGMVIYNLLLDRFDFFNVGFTRAMEKELDKIAKGAGDGKQLLADFEQSLKSNLGDLTADDAGVVLQAHDCPACDDGKLLSISSKKGVFWGCSNFKKGCKATFPDYEGAPFSEEKKCPSCGEVLKPFNGKHGMFFRCSSSSCGNTFNYVDGEVKANKRQSVEVTNFDCPMCKSKLNKVPTKVKGKYFYPCSAESCDFKAFWKEDGDEKENPYYKVGDSWPTIEPTTSG